MHTHTHARTHAHTHRFAYWTISNETMTSLYQLNLSNPTSPDLLTEASVSRKRRQGAGPTLSEIPPTVALAFGPILGRLGVSNRETGDILSCNVTESVPCIIEVEAANFTAGPLDLINYGEGCVRRSIYNRTVYMYCLC